MILSMTGYGKADVAIKGMKIHVEIKTVNSKTMDLSLRISQTFHDMEPVLRAKIAQTLLRGKTDATILAEKSGGDNAMWIDPATIMSYYTQIKNISRLTGIAEPKEWWPVLLRFPEVLDHPDLGGPSDEEQAAVLQATDEALAHVTEFRAQEGAALEKTFREKANNISLLLKSIEPYEHERVARIKKRLTAALESIPEAEYDKGRLEQEMIYYIEKLDISEEKQRLANHLDYFLKTLSEGNAQGKKLGFIAQEMGREINTTGSKSNLAEMQNIVVRMKDELEQIKEQVLNVL